MRARRALTVPAVAAVAVSGAIAFGGCGSSSNAATTDSAAQSSQGGAMKDEGSSMKHKGNSMKDEGSKKHGAGMKDDGKMKHGGGSDSMKDTSSSAEQMEG